MASNYDNINQLVTIINKLRRYRKVLRRRYAEACVTNPEEKYPLRMESKVFKRHLCKLYKRCEKLKNEENDSFYDAIEK